MCFRTRSLYGEEFKTQIHTLFIDTSRTNENSDSTHLEYDIWIK